MISYIDDNLPIDENFENYIIRKQKLKIFGKLEIFDKFSTFYNYNNKMQ